MLLKSLEMSLVQSSLSTLFSLILGSLFAFLLHNSRNTNLARLTRQGLGFFFVFPVMPLVLGVMVCFDWIAQDPYSLAGIVVCHTLLNAPLVALYTLQGWDNIPQHHDRLARLLNLSFLKKARFIFFLPVLRSCLQGVGLAFFLCMTSFTTVLFLSQSTVWPSLSLGAYHHLVRSYDLSQASGYLGLLLVLALAKTIFIPFTGQSVLSPSLRQARQEPLCQSAQIFLTILMSVWAAPLVLGAANLGNIPEISWHIIDSILMSLCLALMCALVSLLLGLMISDLLTGPSPKKGLLLITPLMMPSFVLGIFLFLTLRQILDVDAHAPLIIWGLQTLVCLPFVVRLLTARLGLLKQDSQRMCHILNLSTYQRYQRVYLPQMGHSLASAFAFAGALSLGDLSSVCLFGAGLPTLPTLIAQRMDSFRVEDALFLSYVLGALACLFFTLPLFFQRKRLHVCV